MGAPRPGDTAGVFSCGLVRESEGAVTHGECARLHVLGWTNKRIADELGYEATTVKRWLRLPIVKAYVHPEPRGAGSFSVLAPAAVSNVLQARDMTAICRKTVPP